MIEESRAGFRSSLETYWRLTPATPSGLASRFVRYALVSAARGKGQLERIAMVRGRPIDRTDTVLDIGCGTGGLLVAASDRAGEVVGVDIAARWLVIAQARLREARVENALLVCACAEHLPFPDESFDVIVANDVLEHSHAPKEVLVESRRTLRELGLLLLRTQNRWSLLGEPHVGLWGVGFLPRRWQEPYVRRFRQVSYRLIQLVAAPELDRLLRQAGLHLRHRFVPCLTHGELAGLGRKERTLGLLYNVATRLLPSRLLLLLFGPFLEWVATREAAYPPEGSH